MTISMRLVKLAIVAMSALGTMGSPAAQSAQTSAAASAPALSVWEEPASDLAARVADAMGPGQAKITLRNVSSIAASEVPRIQKLIDQDLKSHGITESGAEGANTIRITLSENTRERLWVAEIVEGSETHVAMVHVDAGARQIAAVSGGMVLRKQTVLMAKEQVLAAMETADGMIVVEAEELVPYSKTSFGLAARRGVKLGQKRPLARDPRGVILSAPNGDGIDVLVAGTECSGGFPKLSPSETWQIQCHESDEPWPIAWGPIAQVPASAGASGSTATLKAFYNAARDYFTGVVTPSVGVDLPAFYSAALLPRPDGAALLINGIDGKVQMVENGALKQVSGTRDWGSDFAVLRHSACSDASFVIASGSGEAASDSLRAYELPGLEAVPASAPLAMEGTVTSVWSEPDSKSVMAVVRHAAGDFEVDRVTALCD
jgi:hypothetical protein